MPDEPIVGRIDLGPTEPRHLTRTEQRMMDGALRRSRVIVANRDRTAQLVTHDAQRGLSYIYLVGKTPCGGVKKTMSVTPDIILDFDADGCLIGIELLQANLLHPTLRERSVRPGSARDDDATNPDC